MDALRAQGRESRTFARTNPTDISLAHGRRNQPINRQRRRRSAAPPSRPRGRQHRITVSGNPKSDPDLDLIAQALVLISRHLGASPGIRPEDEPSEPGQPAKI
jgi:hypothetical protein